MKVMLALLCCAIALGLFYAYQLLRREPVNRYRPARKAVEPSVNSDSNLDDLEDDTDSVLGLKQADKPVISAHSTSTVFIALYLMAPTNSVYGGYELLQALLSAGLRFGDQRIFHRHTHKDGRGDVLFHCASAAAPGTFDMSKMGGFTSPGLCLFFSVSDIEEPLEAFDLMLSTIDQLVEDLGGEVLDEKRQPFNKDKMIQLRQVIRSVEVNKTTMDMFETPVAS